MIVDHIRSDSEKRGWNETQRGKVPCKFKTSPSRSCPKKMLLRSFPSRNTTTMAKLQRIWKKWEEERDEKQRRFEKWVYQEGCFGLVESNDGGIVLLVLLIGLQNNTSSGAEGTERVQLHGHHCGRQRR